MPGLTFLELATSDDSLIALTCPSERRSPHEPTYIAVELERAASDWLISCCDEKSTIVILATSAAREQPDDFAIRKLENHFISPNALQTKVKPLETGRL